MKMDIVVVDFEMNEIRVFRDVDLGDKEVFEWLYEHDDNYDDTCCEYHVFHNHVDIKEQ